MVIENLWGSFKGSWPLDAPIKKKRSLCFYVKNKGDESMRSKRDEWRGSGVAGTTGQILRSPDWKKIISHCCKWGDLWKLARASVMKGCVVLGGFLKWQHRWWIEIRGFTIFQWLTLLFLHHQTWFYFYLFVYMKEVWVEKYMYDLCVWPGWCM